jgi:hypothetical protein
VSRATARAAGERNRCLSGRSTDSTRCTPLSAANSPLLETPPSAFGEGALDVPWKVGERGRGKDGETRLTARRAEFAVQFPLQGPDHEPDVLFGNRRNPSVNTRVVRARVGPQ